MMTQAAQVSIDVDAPPDLVWGALTTPLGLGHAFFDSKVETAWKPGSPIRFKGDWKGKPYEDKGEILAFSPVKRLRFSHWSNLSGVADRPENYHFVTFQLSLAGAKTKVTLTQENANDKPVGTEEQEALAKNWTVILGRLKEAIEGERPAANGRA